MPLSSSAVGIDEERSVNNVLVEDTSRWPAGREVKCEPASGNTLGLISHSLSGLAAVGNVKPLQPVAHRATKFYFTRLRAQRFSLQVKEYKTCIRAVWNANVFEFSCLVDTSKAWFYNQHNFFTGDGPSRVISNFLER